MQFARSLLSLLLVFQFIFAPTAWGQSRNSTGVPQSPPPPLFDDPIVEEFANAPWSYPKFGPFRSDDKILDEDPYFLRTQAWVQTRASGQLSGEFSAIESDGGLLVQAPSSGIALRIDRPLRPLFQTEEFIFLQATDRDLFASKSQKGEEVSEGIFYLAKDYLEAEASSSRRQVPVFFIPLHDSGWTETITAIGFAEMDLLALTNRSGATETLELQDIETATKLYLLNLRMAVFQQLHVQPEVLRRHIQSSGRTLPQDFPFVLPARGSTAGFGMFYTTVDLDNPKNSLVPVLASQSSWLRWLLPQAQASDLLSPDLLQRLLIIGGITTTALVSSVWLKYTVMKDKIKERRQFIERREDDLARSRGEAAPVRSGTLATIKRETKDVVDVFSHMLATVSGITGTSTGYLLEYLADKLPGKVGRSPNGLIRRFLEYTFLYSRKQNEMIAANWNTFILGVAILGSIDTAFVALQLILVSPVFFPWVAQSFGPDMKERIDQSFSGQNADMNNIVTSEIIRNLAAYLVSGAYSYSAKMRATLIEIVKPEIMKEMAAAGLNPLDKENEPEFNKRMEERIDRMLIERGLPSKKEFLFSAPSAVRKLAHFLGYEVSNALPDVADKNDNFLLEKSRWGIVSFALKRALEAAEELSTHTAGPTTTSAIQILKNLSTKFHVLKRMVTNWRHPWQNLKDGVEVRRALTLLSYDGAVLDASVKYKDFWSKFNGDAEGAELAAQLFRQALFGIIQDRPGYLQPSAEESAKLLSEALEEAQQESTRVTNANAEYVLLRAFEILKRKVAAKQNAATAQEWKPAKQDFLERWQAARAHKVATKAVSKLPPVESNDPVELRRISEHRYREEYRKALGRIVGLHALPAEKSELVRAVQHNADEEVEANLNSNPGMKAYVDNLNDGERVRFLTHQYALAFLTNYTSLTVNNSTVVGLTSSEQPGRLQWLRQLSVVDRDTFVGRTLTKSLRAIESLTDPNAHQPGLGYWARRNIPFGVDMHVEKQLIQRGIWVGATVGWATSYYIWQVKFPWDTYVFFYVTSAFTGIASMWLDRFNMNLGNRPMEGLWPKIKYSTLYSWVTYPTYIPFMFYIDDWKNITQSIGVGIQELPNTVTTAGQTVYTGCAELLSKLVQ